MYSESEEKKRRTYLEESIDKHQGNFDVMNLLLSVEFKHKTMSVWSPWLAREDYNEANKG